MELQSSWPWPGHPDLWWPLTSPLNTQDSLKSLFCPEKVHSSFTDWLFKSVMGSGRLLVWEIDDYKIFSLPFSLYFKKIRGGWLCHSKCKCIKKSKLRHNMVLQETSVAKPEKTIYSRITQFTIRSLMISLCIPWGFSMKRGFVCYPVVLLWASGSPTLLTELYPAPAAVG